nr:MAG TPA: ERF superfamily protein [Caudoviricetes sp.]
METKKTLTESLCEVQGALKAPKGQYNSFGKYAYRSCEDIVEAVKPLLTARGLLLTMTDEIVLIGARFYVRATATVTDGKDTVSNTAFAREPDDKKGMDPSQVTGMSSSYARKYALNGLFCIDDTKDADTMDNRQKPADPVKVEQAIAEVNAAKSPDELTALWNKYQAVFGQDARFVKAVMDSPQNKPRG